MGNLSVSRLLHTANIPERQVSDKIPAGSETESMHTQSSSVQKFKPLGEFLNASVGIN